MHIEEEGLKPVVQGTLCFDGWDVDLWNVARADGEITDLRELVEDFLDKLAGKQVVWLQRQDSFYLVTEEAQRGKSWKGIFDDNVKCFMHKSLNRTSDIRIYLGEVLSALSGKSIKVYVAEEEIEICAVT